MVSKPSAQRLIFLRAVDARISPTINESTKCKTVQQYYSTYSAMPEGVSLSDQYSRFKATMADFPYKCRMFLSVLIGLQDEHVSAQVPKAIRKNYEPFTAAFKHLSPSERADFLGRTISFVRGKLLGEKASSEGPNIHEIETTCEARSSFYGVSYWEKRNFKFEYVGGVIKMSTGKKLEIVELKNYLLRQSASEKHTLVLEAIETYLPENRQKISIRFGNRSIFEEIYGNVRTAVQELVNRRLEALLGEEARESERFQEEVVVKGLTFLTQRNINDYLDSKQGLLKKVKSKAYPSFSIYSRDGMMIRNSSVSGKYYFLQYSLPESVLSLEAAKDAVNILSTRSIPKCFSCQFLQSFAHNISANYYKITTDTLECEAVMIVETIERQGRLFRVMKETESANVGVAIPFLTMDLGRGKDNFFVFSLQGVIKISGKGHNKSKEAIKLLLSMVNGTETANSLNMTPPSENNFPYQSSPIRKRSFSGNGKERFGEATVPPSINEARFKAEGRDSSEENNEEGQQFYSIQNEEVQGELQDALNSFSAKNVNIPTRDQVDEFNDHQPPIKKQQVNFLKVKPFHTPLKDYQRKFIHENFLAREWRKMPKGGVLCIDEAVVTEQKRVFKLICKQFGNKLFKMQGLSFSLPVQICRPESGLISMARNVSYAPLLLENHPSLSPFQRFKNIVVLQISMALLALSTRSPFNPVVGETYQGSIYGCPIFMEQISHHPAITYLLFEGRGYRIFGPISPQICVRLNYVKGVNQTWIVVELGGERVEYSIPTMIINGMLFGDRTIYFDSTNYVLDHKNALIAEVVFNAANKGFFSKENPDILQADIFKVTPAFLEAFQASKRTLSPKKDEKNKLLGTITGEWNGKLVLNNETIMDFEKDLPLLLENYPYPLDSDSIYRPDAINLIKGDMERAQQEKEKLEQRQREDKKLREIHSKQKHK